MRQNYSKRRRNSGHANEVILYNLPLLHAFRESRGLTVNGTGTAIRMNPDTVSKVFKGKASRKQVWRVATFLGCDWALLHDLNLPQSEIDRAVLNGKAVRSSGSAAVGVSQTRSVKRGGTYTGTQR